MGTNVDISSAKSKLITLSRRARAQFELIKPKTKIIGEKRYYIPILRGMRPPLDVTDNQNDFYYARTVKDYFSETDNGLVDKMDVFTGLELYRTLKRKLLGEPEDRDDVKEFEGYLSRKFFGSRTVTLIPKEGETIVFIKIGEEKQLPIYQLGDGLQSLIICSFNIFMEKTPCLFFIEEPDLCMHPSMQRAFLEMLLDDKHKHHQYFLTTHSNHLLDMTMDFKDISVFHFTKTNEKGDFQIRVTSTGDHNLLRDLGVRNSSVFLTNATIWVEGITDRLYLREYMKKYCMELKDKLSDEEKRKGEKLESLLEDLHYTFVEYQGSTLTHWNFDVDEDDVEKIKTAFLCAKPFLIADGDIEDKGVRKETLERILKNCFVLLPVKEIENLLPVEILKLVIENTDVKDRAAKEGKKGREVKAIFEKAKVNVDVKYEEYSVPKLGLGEYLDRKLGLPKDQSIYKAPSGTIKRKDDFCKEAIKAMADPTIDWALTTELRELCEKIYDHILHENPMV